MIEFKIISTADKSQQSSYQHPGNELILGNADAEMIIDDPQLAPTHVRVFLQGNQFFIENLVPEMEIRVNGKTVDGAMPIKAKDNLSMGRTTINFSLLDPKPLGPPPKFEYAQAQIRFEAGSPDKAILDALEFLATDRPAALPKPPPVPKVGGPKPPPLPGKSPPPLPGKRGNS